MHIPDVKHRIKMTKLQISNNCLPIEMGGHTKPYEQIEQRLCPCCPKKGEDKLPFTLECNKY